MDTALRERSWTPVAARGREQEPHPDADPAMTRAERLAAGALGRMACRP